MILEPNGKITTEKAAQYLNNTKSPVMKAYLSVMLADYAFVNNAYDSGLRYLKRAVEEYDPIRNDSYYRLVLSRAQKNINESPGKEKPRKMSVLSKFNPGVIKIKPAVEETKTDTIKQEPRDLVVEKSTPEPVSKQQTAGTANFRIQVGAFSVQENAQKKLDYYKEQGYAVNMDRRERASGYLYLARIGSYGTYDEAKLALSELKSKYPSEDGIVIKVVGK